jgi:long-subunit acyl-CoA synthetase (AMP-forming)
MTHPHTLTSLSPAYTVSEDMTHPHTLIAQVWQGDARKLVSEDMPDLKPTIMAAVPRIYARIYDKIMAGVEAKVFLFSFFCC